MSKYTDTLVKLSIAYTEIQYQKRIVRIWEDAIQSLYNIFDDNELIPENIRNDMESVIQDAMSKRISEYLKLKKTMETDNKSEGS